MFKFTTKETEYYDETKNIFVIKEAKTYLFETSLYAISKWESKYEISFFNNNQMSEEQLLYYIECCSLQEIDDFDFINNDFLIAFNEYNEKKHTATVIKQDSNGKSSNRIYTSELLYAYMAIGRIPFECDKWNINRLLQLISAVGVLQSPSKNKSRKQTLEENRILNQKRKQMMNTKG